MSTAVEWLIQHIEKDSDIIFYDRNLHPYQEYIEQAKQMEKEQIMAAWKNGDGEFDKTADSLSEQYYNETFKSK